MKRQATLDYFTGIRDRIYLHWVSTETRAGETVAIKFRLTVEGAVEEVSVVSSPTPEIGEEIRKAVIEGAPYGPMTNEASCIAGRTLRAKLVVPVAPGPHVPAP